MAIHLVKYAIHHNEKGKYHMNETEYISSIKTFMVLLCVGILIWPINLVVVPILTYKIYKKESYSVFYTLGIILPFINWVVIIYLLIESNKMIKDYNNKLMEEKIVYNEEDLKQYENEVNIDEDALNKYLKHVRNKQNQ